MSTIALNVIVWGEPYRIIADDSVALDRVATIAFEAAGIAKRYSIPERWDLRTYEGLQLELHRSISSYQMGDDARLFLSPRAGVGG